MIGHWEIISATFSINAKKLTKGLSNLRKAYILSYMEEKLNS